MNRLSCVCRRVRGLSHAVRHVQGCEQEHDHPGHQASRLGHPPVQEPSQED